MASKDFIPKSNPRFALWSDNFKVKVNLYISGWSLPTEATALWATLTGATKKTRFDTAWAKVGSGHFEDSDEQELKDARKSYESGDKKNPDDISIRSFINRFLRYNPLVTNMQKIDIGIVVPDETKSFDKEVKSKPAANLLAGKVKRADHLHHRNEVLVTGAESKALPEGVKAIQVFIALTESKITSPPDLTAFTYAGDVQRGFWDQYFDGPQEGMRAWYYARMVFKGKKPTYGAPSQVWNMVVN